MQQIQQMHISRLDTQLRGQFESYRSICSCLTMSQAAKIISVLGKLGTMQLSIVTQVVYNLLLSRASKGTHFYWTTPVNMFMMTGYAAMQSMVMLEGSLTGMPQGELQGALSSLQTMCNVLAPTMWSSLYEWDVRRGSPGRMFYSSLAAMQAFRLMMSRLCTNDTISSSTGNAAAS